jgi:hypothetical protein
MKRLTLILAMLCAAIAVAAPTAQGSSKMLTVMQDDALLYRLDAPSREETLDEFQALGADVVKVQVYWRDVAPGGRKKPSGFAGADPASYNWGSYDDVVAGVIARGMRPMLSIGNTAPDWATARVTRRKGIYKPSAKEFKLFAEAVGTRYSGSYNGLPRVDLWSVWNEPNLYSWLSPQRSKGIPQSPSIYRNLYLAAHGGLKATGHGGDTILLGELMPLGGGESNKITPVDFLRELACLDTNFRPYRGKTATRHGCPKTFKRIPTSGIAHHPYNRYRGIDNAPRSGESTIKSLSRITKTTDKIARRGRLPSRLPIWITEYGFQTNPPDVLQNPVKRVPAYMDASEYIAFRNGRVRSYSQYTLIDEPAGPGWQAGLRFRSGKAKPGIYDAFRMPVYVRARGVTQAEVWGGFRTARGATATIASREGRGKYTKLGTARLNSAGYFRKTFRVSNSTKRTYRITIEGRTRTKRPSS